MLLKLALIGTIVNMAVCGGAYRADAGDEVRPGFTVSTSLHGINQVSHVIVPRIFQYIKNIELDDVKFDGGQMNHIVMKVQSPPDVDDINFALNPDNNSIILKAQKIYAHMQGDFNYKKFFLDVDGTAFIDILELGFDLELGLSTQPGEYDNLAPSLKLVNLNVNIDPEKINIKLEGGLVAKIASLFTDIFKNEILGSVIKNVKTEAVQIIEQVVNPDLREFGTQSEVGPIVFDYGLVQAPSVKDFVAIDINGTFFNVDDPTVYRDQPAKIPTRDEDGKAFQFFITDYTLNTFIRSLYTLHHEFNVSEMLRKYFNKRILTKYIGRAIPQFVEKYGENEEVSVKFKFTEVPTVKFVERKLIKEESFFIELGVKGERTLVAKVDKVKLGVSIYNEDGKIFGEIDKPTWENLKVVETTLKGVTEEVLAKELKIYFFQVVDALNRVLTKGYHCPGFHGLDPNDNQVAFHDGFAQFELNLKRVQEDFQMLDDILA